MNQNRVKQSHQHRGPKHGKGCPKKGGKPRRGQNCKIQGVNEWGEPLNIEVPAAIADVIRSLMNSKVKGHKHGKKGGPHNRQSTSKMSAEKLKAKRERIKKLKQKRAARKAAKKLKEEAAEDAADEKELKDLSAEVKDSAENKVVTERIRKAIDNNEKLPNWLVDLLPAVQVSAEIEGPDDSTEEKEKPIWKQKRDEARAKKEKGKKEVGKKEKEGKRASMKKHKGKKDKEEKGEKKKGKRASLEKKDIKEKRVSGKRKAEEKGEKKKGKRTSLKKEETKGKRVSGKRGKGNNRKSLEKKAKGEQKPKRVTNKKAKEEKSAKNDEITIEVLDHAEKLAENNNNESAAPAGDNLAALLSTLNEGEKVELFELLQKLMGQN